MQKTYGISNANTAKRKHLLKIEDKQNSSIDRKEKKPQKHKVADCMEISFMKAKVLWMLLVQLKQNMKEIFEMLKFKSTHSELLTTSDELQHSEIRTSIIRLTSNEHKTRMFTIYYTITFCYTPLINLIKFTFYCRLPVCVRKRLSVTLIHFGYTKLSTTLLQS